MCKAFSALVHKNGRVYWKAGMDSHDQLFEHYKLTGLDRTADPQEIIVARVEITPDKGYLYPEDNWTLQIDKKIKPIWWLPKHEELSRLELDKWKDEIYSGINLEEARNPINPLLIKTHEVTQKDIDNLKNWASVWASVRASVWASVRASVRASVGDSVWASVRASVRASVGASVWASVRASVGDSVGDSVWASVRASVWASVWASVRASVWASVWASVGDSVRDSVGDSVWVYEGSLFTKINQWKYTKHESGIYPYKPAVDLWKRGFVPSFDGKTWRLHQGKDMKVVYEWTKES
jgi:hypothetical protein